MNIFDYAMQMEYDGKKFYLKLSEKSKDKGVKSIFTMLANDEQKHYETFQAMRDIPDKYEMAETEVIPNARNIFSEMKNRASEISEDESQVDLYKQALEMEKKSKEFYLEKADEATVPAQEDLLKKIAAEEERHYNLLENMIDFVTRPQTWLEDAEFTHIGEEY